jgi:hypothetical protein
MKSEFIKKSKLIHGDKYDYSLVEYVNNNTKVKIICSIHGIFEQLPRSHSSGTRCRKCVFDSYKKTEEEFIDEAKKKHNSRYAYNELNYKNMHQKVKIICPIHGEFEQTPNNHLKGYGCQLCLREEKIIKKTNNFISKSNLIHNNKYNYEKTLYINKDEKVIITCPIHGEFKQTPNNHLKNKGCFVCKESKGEREIRKYLIDNKIKFIHQYRFLDCKFKKPLPFDFYLLKRNICIEFNGRQHYEAIDFFGGEIHLRETQKRDKVKKEYCKNNNIKLIIIKFDENVIEKLNELLN